MLADGSSGFVNTHVVPPSVVRAAAAWYVSLSNHAHPSVGLVASRPANHALS